MPKICLFDASGYIHRAYHALPPLSTSKGQPVHALYGVTRMIAKVLKEDRPDFVGVCFDTPQETFRHEMFTDYKGTRDEIDEALLSQLPLTWDLLAAWGLPCIKAPGFEADDVIATLAVEAREKGWDVLILSGDKDILQLVGDRVRVRDEIRKVEFDRGKVFERYGLYPEQLVDYFCLTGDKVDNVPGVPGVGEKTATKLLARHGDLEKLYAGLSEEKETLAAKLAEHRDRVFGNRALIRLRADVPLGRGVDSLALTAPDPQAFPAIMSLLEFKNPLPPLVGGEPAAAVSAAAALPVNTTRKVNVVLDNAELDRLADALGRASVVAYDIETDSLDTRVARLVGLSVAVRPDEAWYVPVGHSYVGAPAQLSWDAVRSKLGRFFEAEGTPKAGQNLRYDNAVLARHGLTVRGPFFDTMIAAYCLDPGRPGFGLKDLAAEFLLERMTRFDEVTNGDKSGDFGRVPIERGAPYAAADAEVCVRLRELFLSRMKEQGVLDLFERLEMPLVHVIQMMEAAGIRVDVPYLETLEKEFRTDLSGMESDIHALAGEAFSIQSPKQLARILFEKLNLPPGRKTKTGFSTDEEVLTKLAQSHPLPAKILAYRERAKLLSTYVDALLASADATTGRVHASFHQTGTITGRLSSTSPNLQNIPVRTEEGRRIRRAFVAAPGCRLLSADYSQIDLRALAHMSNDPVLIETFHQGGDIHAATAAKVFHVDPPQVTPDMRRRAKAINFGVVYGQQAFALSQTLNITMDEARDFIQKYFERYSVVKKWMEETVARAREDGFVTTLAGRVRRIPDILSPNAQARGFAERVAVNTPIQGTSADIIKAAMIRIQSELEKKAWASRMLVQVHDELLFEVPDAELDDLSALVRREMEAAYELRVPLVVDMKVGANWNDMEKLKRGVTA